MQINSELLADDIWCGVVTGRLDQIGTPELEIFLLSQLDAGRTRLLLDMTGATYINSGGLRCLVSAWRRAQQLGGDVVLYGLNERLLDVFAMVGFDKVFTITDSRVAAQQVFLGGEPSSHA